MSPWTAGTDPHNINGNNSLAKKKSEIIPNRNSKNSILGLVKVYIYMNIDNSCDFSPTMAFIMLSLILSANVHGPVFFLSRVKHVMYH